MSEFALRLRAWFTARSPGQWFWLFLLLSVTLRWGSFFISVINHDESTYIVIADEVLRGERYLQDVIDTKPIGIFWLYAGLIKLTGGAIPLLRLAAAACVGLGAWLLYLAGRRATGRAAVGIFAGVAYCWMCAVFTYYGLSPNTEIFFNVFTVAALYLTVASVPLGTAKFRPERDRGIHARTVSLWRWSLAGLLLGVAFVIKPFAAAEAGAIGLFLVYHYANSGRWRRLFTAGAALFLSWCIPTAATYLYYVSHGLTDAFWYYTVDVSAAYRVSLAWYLRAKFMGDYLLRYSPFVVLAIGAGVQIFRLGGADAGAPPPAGGREGLKSKASPSSLRTWFAFLLLQFVFVTVVVLITGKRFGHYQVQLHPVLALLAGTWYALGRPLFPRLYRPWLATYTPLAVCVLSLVMGLVHLNHYSRKFDEAAYIARYFNERLAPNETYFAINGWQISFHLTDRPVPTPYVHGSLLFLDHHKRAFAIDETHEAERIINDPTVRYLVGKANDPVTDTPLKQQLLTVFEPVDSLERNLVIWERRPQ